MEPRQAEVLHADALRTGAADAEVHKESAHDASLHTPVEPRLYSMHCSFCLGFFKFRHRRSF